MKNGLLKTFKIISILFITFKNSDIHAQFWIDSLQYSNKPNFYTIQEKANEYFGDSLNAKSSLFKHYQRWSWYRKSRIMPDGSFPPAGCNNIEINVLCY